MFGAPINDIGGLLLTIMRRAAVVPLFRALSGRLKFTVRLLRINKDSLPVAAEGGGALPGALKNQTQNILKGFFD